MASGLMTAMVVYRPDGVVIKSNFAKAIAYSAGDNSMTFEPHQGTIYSHNDGGFTATWVHSGGIYYKNYQTPLFGYGLEKSVWQDKAGRVTTFENGLAGTEKLIGSKVIICQASSDSKIKIFADYDPKADCPGVTQSFVIKAAALVERELVDEYDASTGKIVPWLIEHKQGNGFESLVATNSYLIQTCIGRYADQKEMYDENEKLINEFIYNRLVIAMVVEG